MPYSDGTYTSPVQDGPKRVFYPFVNNPTKDTTTKGTVRNYVVLPGSFTPAAALSTDPDDSTQYLIEETEPQAEGGYYRFSRTYCKVPGDQVVYGSRVITKPDAGSVGTRRGTNADRVFTDTTLTSLYGFATYANHKFVDNGKVYGPIATTTSANSGGNTRVTWTAHGLAGTEQIIAVASFASNSESWVIFDSGDYSVVDANTIDLTGVNYGGATVYCAEYLRDYTAGTDRVGTKSTQKFYLPGVTSGITTPQDIPLPALLLNDAELLTSLVTNLTGYQTYDATELEPWNDSPIYTQTLVQIDMATL